MIPRPRSRPRAASTNALDAFLGHPTEDDFWRLRRFPGAGGPPRDIPILAATGFYDVESRGPFEVFKSIRSSGGRLLVIGAHDGAAGGTGGVAAPLQALVRAPPPRPRQRRRARAQGPALRGPRQPRCAACRALGQGRRRRLAGAGHALAGAAPGRAPQRFGAVGQRRLAVAGAARQRHHPVERRRAVQHAGHRPLHRFHGDQRPAVQPQRGHRADLHHARRCGRGRRPSARRRCGCASRARRRRRTSTRCSPTSPPAAAASRWRRAGCGRRSRASTAPAR